MSRRRTRAPSCSRCASGRSSRSRPPAFQSDPTVVARLHAGLPPAEAQREHAELALARRDRIAWADLGRVGLASVAAPVFGADDVQAAMAVLGTTTMLPSSPESEERVTMLREAAEQLSAMLNG
jgi:DNA-binding IclR family transcriptional regulator